jgi:hypothetical protein
MCTIIMSVYQHYTTGQLALLPWQYLFHITQYDKIDQFHTTGW